MARSIWLDPDLTVGKVLVSTARVESGRTKRRQSHVASVVLSDAATSDLEWGLLSIIAPNERKFTDDQVERIVALSKNLAAYLSARERMIDDLMETVHDEVPEPTGAPRLEGDDAELEDFILENVRDEEILAARAWSGDTEPDADLGVLDRTDDDFPAAEVPAADEDLQADLQDLIVRAGNNGNHETPVRTVHEETNDDIHVITPTPPRQRDAACSALGRRGGCQRIGRFRRRFR